MSCKNCGSAIIIEQMRSIQAEINELRNKLHSLLQRQEAMANGFCDSYCQSNFKGVNKK